MPSLVREDVSFWSGAAEIVLVEAFRFAGGLVLDRGLVLGRVSARCRTDLLGGLEVWNARAPPPERRGGKTASTRRKGRATTAYCILTWFKLSWFDVVTFFSSNANWK